MQESCLSLLSAEITAMSHPLVKQSIYNIAPEEILFGKVEDSPQPIYITQITDVGV